MHAASRALTCALRPLARGHAHRCLGVRAPTPRSNSNGSHHLHLLRQVGPLHLSWLRESAIARRHRQPAQASQVEPSTREGHTKEGHLHDPNSPRSNVCPRSDVSARTHELPHHPLQVKKALEKMGEDVEWAGLKVAYVADDRKEERTRVLALKLIKAKASKT